MGQISLHLYLSTADNPPLQGGSECVSLIQQPPPVAGQLPDIYNRQDYIYSRDTTFRRCEVSRSRLAAQRPPRNHRAVGKPLKLSRTALSSATTTATSSRRKRSSTNSRISRSAKPPADFPQNSFKVLGIRPPKPPRASRKSGNRGRRRPNQRLLPQWPSTTHRQ
jgi:hypothetical protein